MRSWIGILSALCAIGCSKKQPDANAFVAAWKTAAAAKDGAAAWKLVDRTSKAHIVAALERMQQRAQKDEDFKKLVAWTFAPADPLAPPDELAQRLLASQLAVLPNTGEATVATKGNDSTLSLAGGTTRLHREDGAWHVQLEAMALSDGDAPVVVEYMLPLGPPPAVPPPSTRPERAAAQPAAVDPSTPGEPVEEVRQEQKDTQGRWAVTISHRTASGKLLWYRRFFKDSDDYVETDLIGHTETVANDATKELTRFQLTDNNEELSPTRRTEVYVFDKDAPAGQPPRLLRIRYLDDKMVLHLEKPDETVPALHVVYRQKDSKGEDLAKLSPEARDKVLVEEDRIVDDRLVAVTIHGNAADYDKALDRAGTLAHLPEGLASAARSLMWFEETRVGSTPTIRDVSFTLSVPPEARLDVTESASPAEQHTKSFAFSTL